MRARSLFVLGTGGLAREMAQLARHVDEGRGRWRDIAFIAESAAETGRDLGLGSVAGDDAWLLSRDGPADIVIGIGSPAVRAAVIAAYLGSGDRFDFPNLIHPTAILDRPHVELGRGNAVTAGCILTVDIQVADFNVLNLQTTVGHDAVLGSFNVVNPSVNISGGVAIGDRILIGTGAQVLELRSIGSDATVGAGAVVNRDVAPGTVVVGVPARPLGAAPAMPSPPGPGVSGGPSSP